MKNKILQQAKELCKQIEAGYYGTKHRDELLLKIAYILKEIEKETNEHLR